MSVKLTKELVEFVRPSEHSIFSPSGGDKWMACPASIALSKPIEEETSKYAAEGTLAHKVCEDFFAFKHYDVPKSIDLQMADDEMIDGAQMYYDCIMGWLGDHHEEVGDILWFGLEKGIPVFPQEGCFGTADGVIVGTKGCVIIDYKYGRRHVTARSTQLQIYLLGLKRHLIDLPEDYKFHSVVVQPRTDAIPKHDYYTYAEMLEFEPKVYEAIQQSKIHTEPVEGRHCFWCKARRTNDPALKCPAIKAKAMAVANENFDKFLTDMNEPVKTGALSSSKRDKALIKILSLRPLVNQLAEEAEGEFKHRMDNGEIIDGIQFAETKGRSKWIHDDDTEMTKEIVSKFPEVMPFKTVTKLKTITEVKKEVGKKNFDDSLVVRPIKKKVIVQDQKTREVLADLASYSKMIGIE